MSVALAAGTRICASACPTGLATVSVKLTVSEVELGSNVLVVSTVIPGGGQQYKVCNFKFQICNFRPSTYGQGDSLSILPKKCVKFN